MRISPSLNKFRGTDRKLGIALKKFYAATRNCSCCIFTIEFITMNFYLTIWVMLLQMYLKQKNRITHFQNIKAESVAVTWLNQLGGLFFF